MSNSFVRVLAGGWQKILTKAWPHACFACGEAAGDQILCAECRQLLQRLPGQVCPICALPVPASGLPCGACLHRPPYFDATRAAFVYAHPVREMLLALKHGQGFAQLEWLGRSLCEQLDGLKADCVLPAPLHAQRQIERGFNQANELAKYVARASGLPLLRDQLLREQATPRLAGLRQRQRRRVLRGVFRCSADLSGQHVLLVDDVMTSGATLNELARTLKQSGALRVTNLVVARTLKLRPA